MNKKSIEALMAAKGYMCINRNNRGDALKVLQYAKTVEFNKVVADKKHQLEKYRSLEVIEIRYSPVLKRYYLLDGTRDNLLVHTANIAGVKYLKELLATLINKEA